MFRQSHPSRLTSERRMAPAEMGLAETMKPKLPFKVLHLEFEAAPLFGACGHDTLAKCDRCWFHIESITS